MQTTKKSNGVGQELSREALIEIRNMNKWYDDFQVLKNINFSVDKGERVVICGPSGSGKSTLIRCVNRLEEHQQGHIIFDGIELTDNLKNIDKIRSEIGMCFQHTTGYFKDRMTPVPEFGKEAGINASKYLNILERRLGVKEFIAGDTFSIADITALCAMDFARVVKIRMTDEHVNLARWYEAVSNRESAKA